MKIINISENLKNEIINEYHKKSLIDVAKQFNTTPITIKKIIKNSGIKFTKHRYNLSNLALNIDYFKEINSNDKAYWLGFICADGSINKKNNKVSLISKDIEVIEGFKKAIGSEHTIRKNENFDKRTNKTYTGYSIQIGNKIFTNNLINLGITSNKTNVLEFPKIEEKYYSYFIAGLFDGDGSVSWSGKNKDHLRVSLISTQEILNYIDDNIFTYLNIKPIKYRSLITKNKSNVWKVYLYKDAHRFLEYIYSDENFKYYLKRKLDIYKLNINKRNNIRYLKKIEQFDINMNLIKTWNSQQDIANALLCPPTTLNNYLKKYKNRTYKNYYWRYEDDIK